MGFGLFHCVPNEGSSDSYFASVNCFSKQRMNLGLPTFTAGTQMRHDVCINAHGQHDAFICNSWSTPGRFHAGELLGRQRLGIRIFQSGTGDGRILEGGGKQNLFRGSVLMFV